MLVRWTPLCLLLLLHVSVRGAQWNLFRLPTANQQRPQDGDVRLVGSKVTSTGRVEVYHNGKWGTVCDDNWDMAEAQVVCRQLHFPGARSVVSGKSFGEASGPIWLDDLKCEGTESRLVSCSFKDWGVTDCTHTEDAAVICETADANATTTDVTYSLDHSISLSDDLGRIFDSGDGCDFTILMQSSTGNLRADGTEEMNWTNICVHKLLLLQYPGFNVTDGITSINVSVSQTCEPHFSSFIRYIYTRRIDVTSWSAQCLHWMASQFGVKPLMEDVGRLFTRILPDDASFHNQVSLYKYAQDAGDFVLSEQCVQFLAWNYQNLTASPAWTSVSSELLQALLSRSDLVVPDEYFLLQSVESWLTQKNSSLETQAALLSLIRFPMISAEKLYELSNSSLYSAHVDLFRENMLKAFQFQFLLLSNLKSKSEFVKDANDYQPRIYTVKPWSTDMQRSQPPSGTRGRGRDFARYGSSVYPPSYNQYDRRYHQTLNTPAHTSLIFKNNRVEWVADVFSSQNDCSNRGVRCNSLPVVRLAPQNAFTQLSNIVFHNKLVVVCQSKHVAHVQEFKLNMAHIAVNGTHVVTYPCPNENYVYRVVVRPMYV